MQGGVRSRRKGSKDQTGLFRQQQQMLKQGKLCAIPHGSNPSYTRNSNPAFPTSLPPGRTSPARVLSARTSCLQRGAGPRTPPRCTPTACAAAPRDPGWANTFFRLLFFLPPPPCTGFSLWLLPSLFILTPTLTTTGPAGQVGKKRGHKRGGQGRKTKWAIRF